VNLVLIALAVLVVVAVFVGYAAVVAGARADRRSEDFEGGAGSPSSSPRGAGSPTRTALRVVGGPSIPEAAPPSARRVPPGDSPT
jgi:hypothetical protein